VDTSWLYVIGLAVLALLIIHWQRQTGAPPALSPADEFRQATVIACDLVAAAEQLWLTGHLPKDARYQWVYTQLGDLFPGLNPNQREALIESAVWFMKQGFGRLTQAAEDQPD
jgi:hypothetical protein